MSKKTWVPNFGDSLSVDGNQELEMLGTLQARVCNGEEIPQEDIDTYRALLAQKMVSKYKNLGDKYGNY